MLVNLNNFVPDQIIPRSKSSTELIEMWKTFVGQPGIKKELGRRQKKMQKIGKELVKLKTITGVGKVPTTSKSGDVKVGRNDPCPCGSGKKFKKCCNGQTKQIFLSGIDSSKPHRTIPATDRISNLFWAEAFLRFDYFKEHPPKSSIEMVSIIFHGREYSFPNVKSI